MSDLTGILQGLNEVIDNPTANLTAAIFLLSAVVLLILILMIAVTVLLLPSGRSRRDTRSRRGSAGSARPEDISSVRRPGPGLGSIARSSRWTVPALLVLAIVSTYAATSSDTYCVSCHVEVRAKSSEHTSTATIHESVACTACHERATEVLGNSLRRLSDVGARLGVSRSLYADSVTSAQCMRCHQAALREPSTNEVTGVVMSHAEPLEAGWACRDCHSGGGHAQVKVVAGMSSCLQCHDAESVDAACVICHAKDTSAASGLAQDRVYGRAKIVRNDCEGCHSMESCDECHGLRMPHPEVFLRTHPRYAGFDKKAMCYEKCHSAADCGACHGAWDSHLPSFKQEHKSLPKDTGCPSCHDQHEGPMCDLCHDFNK